MTDTATLTLTDFLLARIAEDEAAARKAAHQQIAGPFHGNWRADSLALSVIDDWWDRAHIARHDPARVLAECEAKRRIVEELERDSFRYSRASYWMALRLLAAVYSDHADYRDDWRALDLQD